MELQGSRHAAGCRFAVVVSRFNEDVTARLLQGALDTLEQAEVSADDITLVRVPGAFEIPLTAMRMGVRDYLDKNHDLNRDTFSAIVRNGIWPLSHADTVVACPSSGSHSSVTTVT